MKTRVRSTLADIRNNRGISASEIALRWGLTSQTIYAIEAGNYVPNTEVALRLARELEVSVEELFALDQRREQGVASLPAEFLGSSRAAKGQAVRLGQVGNRWVSVPVSASPYFLTEADGILADQNRVMVFPSDGAAKKRIVLAGCDPATSLLASMVERAADIEIVHAPASSELSLRWLKEDKVHIAGSHLEDPKTAEFNLPFIHREFGAADIGVITFAQWEEGFVVARGNPKHIRTVGDLQRKNVWFMNRQPGSGSRLLLDRTLREAGISPRSVQGYARVA